MLKGNEALAAVMSLQGQEAGSARGENRQLREQEAKDAN